MEIAVDKKEDIVVFKTMGEMDLYNSGQFRETFHEHYDAGHKKFIFDLQDLTYIDSTGVGTIISTFTTLRKQKGELFISGVQGVVKKVIDFTKLNGFLPIVVSIDEALHKLNVSETSLKGERQKSSQSLQTILPGIRQDDSDPLFNQKGMYHKDFNLDLKKVRYLSQLIVQKAPNEIREINLLEQQISELIKNAVRHGNKNNPNKKVKIWFAFDRTYAHLIVEDEGDGFKDLDRWNDFYRKKQEAFASQEFDEMLKYISYRTPDSTDDDGGNALFAAVEFWNKGIVFNSTGNKVAVKRSYE